MQRFWTDEEMLLALHLRENEGRTMQAVADRLGRKRNAVIGLINRINADTDKTDNGNQNGTMPQKWWKR